MINDLFLGRITESIKETVDHFLAQHSSDEMIAVQFSPFVVLLVEKPAFCSS